MSFNPEVLKKIRLQQPGRITQSQVAKGIKMSRANYSKKESGDITITIEDIDRLATFYGVKQSVFFDETEDKGEGYPSVEPEKPTEQQIHKDDNMKLIKDLNRLIIDLHKKIDEKDKLINELQRELKELKTRNP